MSEAHLVIGECITNVLSDIVRSRFGQRGERRTKSGRFATGHPGPYFAAGVHSAALCHVLALLADYATSFKDGV